MDRTTQEEKQKTELQTETEKSSKSGANNEKKICACNSSAHMIKTYRKQRNIFVTYKERREITKRDITNIMEDYGTIKRLKSHNNMHTNHKALICFETKEEAQRAIAGINQYPGWKASLSYSRHKTHENREEGQSDTNNLTEEKNSKKIKTYHQRHKDNNEEIIVIHNIETKEMECHSFGSKYHKIRECQTKQNIYIVNLKKRLRSKLEIQEEMQQYENIKSIKVRRDRYGYEINKLMVYYTTQKEAEKAVSQINKGTVWHAEIYQNRYKEINEDRNKKINENNNGESKRNKANNERKNHQIRKRIDKWQEKMDVLKSDISLIKEYIKITKNNKRK